MVKFGKRLGVTALMSALLLVGGCDVYPLPKDVIGISTEDIVIRVRCEMRDAIRKATLQRISLQRDEIVYGDFRATDLVYAVEHGDIKFEELDAKKFKGQLYKDFKRYGHAQVNYDFTLQGTEMNSQGAQIGLTRRFPGGRVDTIGLSAQADRTRDVKRNFRVFDDFAELSKNYNNAQCDVVRHIDLVYPIGGEKRIHDLVESFLGINQGQNLAGTAADPITPAMADTLTFTTKLSGGVTPGVALAPTGPGLLLSSVSFPNTNYRQDIHTLIISLTLPTDDPRLAKSLKDGLSYGRYTLNQIRQIEGERALDQQRQRNVQDAVLQLTATARLLN